MLLKPLKTTRDYEALCLPARGPSESTIGHLVELCALSSKDYSHRWARRIASGCTPHIYNALHDEKRRCICYAADGGSGSLGRAGTPQQLQPWPPGPAR